MQLVIGLHVYGYTILFEALGRGPNLVILVTTMLGSGSAAPLLSTPESPWRTSNVLKT